jgi:hypothetical protein
MTIDTQELMRQQTQIHEIASKIRSKIESIPSGNVVIVGDIDVVDPCEVLDYSHSHIKNTLVIQFRSPQEVHQALNALVCQFTILEPAKQ